jgi:multisubunit Na+/H+ antiporter MnhG subunit
MFWIGIVLFFGGLGMVIRNQGRSPIIGFATLVVGLLLLAIDAQDWTLREIALVVAVLLTSGFFGFVIYWNLVVKPRYRRTNNIRRQ